MGYNYRDYSQFPLGTGTGNMEDKTCAEQQYAIRNNKKTFCFVAWIVFLSDSLIDHVWLVMDKLTKNSLTPTKDLKGDFNFFVVAKM